MTFDTAAFKKLRKEWLKKLEADGFDDIETHNGFLKSYSHNMFLSKSSSPVQNEAKTIYYRLAGQFLYSHNFDNSVDQLIWEHHTNSISVENISKILAKKKIKMSHATVHKVVKRLSKIMFEKERIENDEE